MGWEGRESLVERLNYVSSKASKRSALSRILGALFFTPLFIAFIWFIIILLFAFTLTSTVFACVAKLIGNTLGAIYMLLDATVLGIYFTYILVTGNEKANR